MMSLGPVGPLLVRRLLLVRPQSLKFLEGGGSFRFAGTAAAASTAAAGGQQQQPDKRARSLVDIPLTVDIPELVGKVRQTTGINKSR